MWIFGYPYILYFVLHWLNSMRPSNMYMHLWNDVIAGLDSGLLTIGAKALSKPMPIYCLFTHRIKFQTCLTNTNSFNTVTFRIMFLYYWQARILTTFAHAQTNRRASHLSALGALVCVVLINLLQWLWYCGLWCSRVNSLRTIWKAVPPHLSINIWFVLWY